MAHLKAKQAGMPPPPKQSWAAPRRAINLMEALRRARHGRLLGVNQVCAGAPAQVPHVIQSNWTGLSATRQLARIASTGR
jgi:hypothetical protein